MRYQRPDFATIPYGSTTSVELIVSSPRFQPRDVTFEPTGGRRVQVDSREPATSRGRPVDWRGIVPGDDSALIWREVVRWQDVPKLVNPASGSLPVSPNATRSYTLIATGGGCSPQQRQATVFDQHADEVLEFGIGGRVQRGEKSRDDLLIGSLRVARQFLHVRIGGHRRHG